MPKLERVAKEISEIEGFEVALRPQPGETPAKSIPSYKRTYQRCARNNHTVKDFLRLRIEKDYPSLAVDVLLADGRVATGRTTLSRVRQSYS